MKTTFSIVALALALGCGGAPKESTTTPPPPAGEHKLPAELDAFHEVLGPRWHASQGQGRKDYTCVAMMDFKMKSAAVKASAAPAGVDAAKWAEGGTHLEGSVTALETACGGTDVAAFDAALKTVHEEFHELVEMAGGHKFDDDHEHHGDEKHEHGHDDHGDDHDHEKGHEHGHDDHDASGDD